MLGSPHHTVISTRPGGGPEGARASLGMRRVCFVRILVSDGGVACQAVGTGNRRPTVRPVSLSTAAALAASGVPTIVRSPT